MTESSNTADIDPKWEQLLADVREAVAEGKSVRDLVQMIYLAYEIPKHNATLVIRTLIDAFGLRFGQVKEVAAANCIGTGTEIHSDKEIDALLLPLLREALEE